MGETAAFDQQTGEVDALRRAVLALPVPQRQVVVLRYLEDRAEGDVADLLGVPAGTVKSRLARAMTALRSDLATREEHHDG